MPDDQPTTEVSTGSTGDAAADAPAKKAAARKSAAKKAPAKKAPAKKTAAKTAAKRTTKKAAATADAELPLGEPTEAIEPVAAPEADAPAESAAPRSAAKKAPAKKAPAKKAAAKKTTTRKSAAKKADPDAVDEPTAAPTAAPEAAEQLTERAVADTAAAEQGAAGVAPLFQAPSVTTTTRRTRKSAAKKVAPAPVEEPAEDEDDLAAAAAEVPEAVETVETDPAESAEDTDDSEDGEREGGARRRRRRGGRRRRKSGEGQGAESDQDDRDDQGDQGDQADQSGRGGRSGRREQSGRDSRDNRESRDNRDSTDSTDSTGAGPEEAGTDSADEQPGEGASRRRRRRRRSGEGGSGSGDDPENTVTRVRKPRSAEDEITAIAGSTRLEAKKQRRRDGREAGRRRAPIVSEAEFLARRESVDRVMVIRQREDLTQIGVLEDKVLVEHYVARESQTSLIGNVYLGRVQNVLPSMEAAFIDIGKGRNAVLYAGEVNWSALGHKDGQPRKIESVLSSGQSVLVQVTKDPIGHKGARLTSQISLAGRFLVYVPDGTTSGISRKLPDTERSRLKALLKEIVPESAGVIVRTAAEGAAEDELTRDVERLKARWEDIEKKSKGSAPQLLYGEPDLTLKVVRDLFTEDFAKLVIEGDGAWETVQQYVAHVAPDLEERLERYFPEAEGGRDVFSTYRVEEQIAKALDRKVWLPSGGSLVIDRTEAMTVVDVNTGKFTGSGGNLEETVTKNNLEAAEEVVRQLRLRDIGGIIVVDFIDMVLESNRDLVLRRLVECLGRDRTRHQVAEVTSLGLVQMTRKRIGTGLLEAFGENCEHCHGRGVVIHDHPVEARRGADEDRGRSGGTGRRRGGKGRGDDAPADRAPEKSEKSDKADRQGGRGGRQAERPVPVVSAPKLPPTPKDVAAMARPEAAETAETAETAEGAVSAPESVPEQVVEVAAPEAPVAPVSAPAEVAPSEPEAPKVVTRTRRRSASRPAGQPEAASVAAIVVEQPAEPAAPTAQAGAPETAPQPPRVVTRTRTRSANRPAGPPEATTHELPGETPGEDGDEAPAHVPVKKKSSRKR